jgi:hypothetical protein
VAAVVLVVLVIPHLVTTWIILWVIPTRIATTT